MSCDPVPTRMRLANELRMIPMLNKLSPENAAKYEAFAKRAATGEFDDFGALHVCPIAQLHSELTAAGFKKFAARVANGEFDATLEESDAWVMSPEGQATFRQLPEAMRRAINGGEDPLIPDQKH